MCLYEEKINAGENECPKWKSNPAPVTDFISNELCNCATEANMVGWVIGSDRQVAW